jgi:S-adenosylmethionine:tRNA ribosyltransferase-isomerase
MSYYKLLDYDYDLPKELIAIEPAQPRDRSRLLVLDKKTGEIKHKHFYEIVDYLNEGDVLVLNNSKVIPARLMAHKKDTGGQVEILLHRKISDDIWQCLLGGRIKEKLKLSLPFLGAEVLKNNNDGTWDVKFNKSGADLMKTIEMVGEMPLPPYIVKQRERAEILPVTGYRAITPLEDGDNSDYQTVYANKEKAGSVAAPTAGLHFTPELLKKIKNKGVNILEITLYVGMGTFTPVKTENILEHKMHAEWVEIEQSTIVNLQSAIENKKRIIAVGTTSARSLEACWNNLPKVGEDFKSWVDIFIYPGYEFKIVDAMITNFHLPKSTLLMLVSALAGKENIDKAYQEAIKEKYRFYSYGDAMLIK